jgi:catechol 2,3-dioxygenase-like lactoylglutathione lyase family enzyme
MIFMNTDTAYLQGNFKGIQHLGIPVTNLEASVSFYTRLGFKRILASKVEVPEENDRIVVAFMEQKDIVIELYQVTARARKELVTRSDGHLDHIAFDVADVDKAFAELKEAGFEMIEDKPVRLDFWERGCRYFTVRGPNGEKLEFNQIL